MLNVCLQRNQLVALGCGRAGGFTTLDTEVSTERLCAHWVNMLHNASFDPRLRSNWMTAQATPSAAACPSAHPSRRSRAQTLAARFRPSTEPGSRTGQHGFLSRSHKGWVQQGECARGLKPPFSRPCWYTTAQTQHPFSLVKVHYKLCNTRA